MLGTVQPSLTSAFVSQVLFYFFLPVIKRQMSVGLPQNLLAPSR